jgi:hypothetical protein
MSLALPNTTSRSLVPIRRGQINSFIDAVRTTYPAHYALYNTEIHFSNMLLADLGLADKAFKAFAYVSDRTCIITTN